MGRYSAPQTDHYDRNIYEEDHMDWEAISNDDDDEYDDELHTTQNSLVHNCKQNNNGASNNYTDSVAYHEHQLQMAEEEYNKELKLQKRRKRGRARIRTFILSIIVVLIAIVLRRNAPPPPPPPLLFSSPFATTGTSLDTGGKSTATKLDEDHFNKSMLMMQQHETWSSYTKHILNLVHHALRYGMSVAYYAISNAFVYSFEDVRDVAYAYNGYLSNKAKDMYVNADESLWMALKERVVVSIEDMTAWFQLVLQRIRTGVSFTNSSGMNNNDESVWIVWKQKLAVSIEDITAWFHNKLKRDQTESYAMDDDGTQQPLGRENDTLIKACPINTPGATASNNNHQLPTEDCLRQRIGASLPTQNLALQIIADGLDKWGGSLVKQAPVESVQQMANAVQSIHENDGYISKQTLDEWILPPATSFLLVGSEGVGKLHVARRLAHLLLGHCSNDAPASSSSIMNDEASSYQALRGVLEVNGGSFSHEEFIQLIGNHIQSRKGMGSVIIIQHIELLATQAVDTISQVLSGQSNTFSYKTSDVKLVEVSTIGTVFVMTSKWGTESIFQYIQQNNVGVEVLHRHREHLISTIRRYVDSDLVASELARHITIAPVLPLQRDELSSILQSRIEAINLKYQNLHHWKRLVVSLAAIRYFVGIDHIDYLDVNDQDQDGGAILTYSTSGAHPLNSNTLLQKLHNGIVIAERRRSDYTLKVGLDIDSSDKGALSLSWCKVDIDGIERCEVEGQSLFSYS